MDKSPDAFRTISEVAEHLDTPAHVLRFWESRFPQIRPVKRAGGRRYYRPSDVSLLTGIKRLLHDEGMTIRGVQKILREQGVRHVAGLSGDAVDHEADDSAMDASGFSDSDAGLETVEHAQTIVVPLKPEPAPYRPAASLASALAKAMEHDDTGLKTPSAPSSATPTAEPMQGTLLLTPATGPTSADGPSAEVVADVAQETGADEPVDVTEQDIAALVAASTADTALDFESADPVATLTEPLPDPIAGDDDFADDDFDDGPVTTLASRIRSLPSDASAAKVRPELRVIQQRLLALRDVMNDAAQSGRV